MLEERIVTSPLPPAILVIDADPQFTYLIQRYANRCGCRCLSAHAIDTEQPLAQQDRPALIVFDIATPSASNRQMMQRLKAAPATFDIPIVICSALADGIRIWEEGADYYLGKPVMYDDFVAMLINAGVLLPQ
jgi:DNA-binding response OmpR family regulator